MKNFTLIKQSLLFPLIVCIIFCCGCIIQAEYEYTVILPLGWKYASAKAVNDNGVVAGDGLNEALGVDRDYFYSNVGFIYEEGEYTEIVPPGWTSIVVKDINDNQVVVGVVSEGGTDNNMGFIYENGEYTELQPAGWLTIESVAINNNGVVVGYGSFGREGYGNPLIGFIYHDGEYTKLLPPEFEETEAEDINDKGEVLLRAAKYKGGYSASHFIYIDGEYNELPASNKATYLRAINNNGEAVGLYDRWPTEWDYVGALYSNGDYYVLLPPRWMHASANDINDNGVVVGDGYSNRGTSAFIYDHGIYSELLVPGSKSTEALAINNRGIVVGRVVKDDYWRGFIGTPIIQ